VGSNPTVALVLVALLPIFRFGGEKLKEVIMDKKQRNSKSSACKTKETHSKLASIIVHIFETVWAIGANAAVVLGISTSTHRRGA
jgi:hypothetical protein